MERLVPACDNVVADGMEVFTNSPHGARGAPRQPAADPLRARHELHELLAQRQLHAAVARERLQYARRALSHQAAPGGGGLLHAAHPRERQVREVYALHPDLRERTDREDVGSCSAPAPARRWTPRATAASRIRTVPTAASASRIAPRRRCGSATTRRMVFDAIDDPNTVTVVQVAPAVRAAWAEQFNLSPEFATRQAHGGCSARAWASTMCSTPTLPPTSPSWRRAASFSSASRTKRTTAGRCSPPAARAGCAFSSRSIPERTEELSTAKSPQQMFGAIAKTYFAEKIGIDPKRLFVVSIMPCVAKKSE